MRTDVLCVKKRLVRMTNRFLVPLVLTRGVVQRATLVVLPSDNVASAEPVATEQLIVQWVNHHLQPETIAGAVHTAVVTEHFIITMRKKLGVGPVVNPEELFMYSFVNLVHPHLQWKIV